MTQFTLLPGRALVELEALFKGENIGGIILPENIRSKLVLVGRILAVSLTDRDKRCGLPDDMKGYRVILDGGIASHVGGNVYVYHNTHAVTGEGRKKKYGSPYTMLVGPEVKIDAVSDANKRCKFCGPAKEGSTSGMMLVPRGPGKAWYCPRCNRDEHGIDVKIGGNITHGSGTFTRGPLDRVVPG